MRLHRHDSGRWQADKRGHDLGERWAGQIGAAVGAYRQHFDQLGLAEADVNRIADASLDALRAWSPPLGAEVASIAAGAGRPLRELALLNARTEILASVPRPDDGECSTLVRVPTPAAPDASVVAFQTWDWHSQLAEDGLLWRYEPAPGRWVKTFTEFGMLAKIGLNSAGLAVHFNLLHHRSDSAAGGVPVHAIARRILDEASTVDEACDLARSARVSGSTAITVVAAGGPADPDAVSIELAPEGVGILRPGSDGWLARTNHFLSPELEAGDRRLPTSTTADRLEHLRGIVADEVAGDDLPSLARALCGSAGPGAPICLTGDIVSSVGQPWHTLLTVRLDPVKETFEGWPGTPYEAAEAGVPERL